MVPSPLKVELASLKRNLAYTEVSMEEIAKDFWRNGGVCCPSCGSSEFRKLELKQERRQQRIEQIKAKLKRDA